jgi:hypothetical protein
VQLCWISSMAGWLVEVCLSLHKLEDSDILFARPHILRLANRLHADLVRLSSCQID